MLFIDLSHIIEDGMPVFPGTPEVKVSQFSTVDQEGYAEKELHLATHIGTHMDAPAHMISQAKTLDQYQVSDFTGTALMISFTHDDLDEKDQVTYLSQFEDKIREVDFIILKTDWSKKWGTPDYLENFPALDAAGAEYLSGFRIKGVGIDAISIDKSDAQVYLAHQSLLGNQILIIENLRGLENIRYEQFKLYVFPLKLKDADGSPVRAIAEMS